MQAKYVGLILSLLFISVFSLIFIGAGVSFPSTIIMLLLISNSIYSFFSIFVQQAVRGLYEYNYFTEKVGVYHSFNQYTTLALFGINYYVQLVLRRMPFLINKLLSVCFFLLLLFQFFTIVSIFD